MSVITGLPDLIFRIFCLFSFYFFFIVKSSLLSVREVISLNPLTLEPYILYQLNLPVGVWIICLRTLAGLLE